MKNKDYEAYRDRLNKEFLEKINRTERNFYKHDKRMWKIWRKIRPYIPSVLLGAVTGCIVARIVL